jgi:hypothetical protein
MLNIMKDLGAVSEKEAEEVVVEDLQLRAGRVTSIGNVFVGFFSVENKSVGASGVAAAGPAGLPVVEGAEFVVERRPEPLHHLPALHHRHRVQGRVGLPIKGPAGRSATASAAASATVFARQPYGSVQRLPPGRGGTRRPGGSRGGKCNGHPAVVMGQPREPLTFHFEIQYPPRKKIS